jgi:hypothetical protein
MRWLAPLLGLALAVRPALAAAAPVARGAASKGASAPAIAPVSLGQNGPLSLNPAAPELSAGVLPNIESVALETDAFERAAQSVRVHAAHAQGREGAVDHRRGLQWSGPEAESRMRSRISGKKARRDPPVERILETSDVLLLGESHTSKTSVVAVAGNLERLKEAGVGIVGIEGLKTYSQQDLDAYFDNRTDRLPADALRFSPARTDEFTELLAEAKRTGVRPIALGRPLDQWSRRVAGLAAARTGRAPLSFGTDLVEMVGRADRGYERGFNESVAQVVLTERNTDMADILAGRLAKGGKAVVLAGNAHVEHPEELHYRLFGLPVSAFGTLADALARRSLAAFSLTLTGGLFNTVQDAADQRALLGPLYALLANAPSGSGRTSVRTSERTALWHLGGSVPNLPGRAGALNNAADGR